MKYRLSAIALAISLLAAPAFSGELEDNFFTMDRSGDGQLSREEFVVFQTGNGASERQADFAFDNLRGDDNRITLSEFRNGPAARLRAPRRRVSSAPQRAQPRRATRRTAPPRRSSGGSGS